ncbi:hypothetical protein D6777_01245 [Candidatus Woesearchaeota archaeon]|nr:MAG: hypothetical protein D6777_01245 [Candidatus Woesearchaeota archaeon]
MMQRLLDEAEPTQVYVTLSAPTKEVYQKTCNPLIPDQWEMMVKSLEILTKFKRSTIRMTLVKGLNMLDPESYAKLLLKYPVKFIELKAAMAVGYSRYRMEYSSMPLHSEIKDFAEKICNLTGLKIIDEKPNSRVVLLMKEDFKERRLNFD